MKVEHDDELQGCAMVFENITEILESAQKQDPAGVVPLSSSSSWREMSSLSTWGAVTTQCRNAWSDGISAVEKCGEEIAKSSPPQPVSIRRQRRWSENDGEIDIDRALRGEPDCLRESYRTRRPRSQNIAIMCDVGAGAVVRNADLLWRSAAVIAAIDILEESGYRCEVWAYDLGRQCYLKTKNHHSFVAWMVKDAGDALDLDNVVKCLSPWFFRTALFANYSLGGLVDSGKGYHTIENRERWFGRHCRIDSGMERIWMPSAKTESEAIASVRNIIESIQQPT